jgi:hypothetical protein
MSAKHCLTVSTVPTKSSSWARRDSSNGTYSPSRVTKSPSSRIVHFVSHLTVTMNDGLSIRIPPAVVGGALVLLQLKCRWQGDLYRISP